VTSSEGWGQLLLHRTTLAVPHRHRVLYRATPRIESEPLAQAALEELEMLSKIVIS
jgi:hypothetical protein